MKNQPAENAKCSGMLALPWHISSFEPTNGGAQRVIMGSDGFAIAYIMGRSAEEHQAIADAILAALSAQSGGERETIERCAKVAESFDTFDYDTALSARGATVAIGISAAIRALAAPQNPSSEGEG